MEYRAVEFVSFAPEVSDFGGDCPAFRRFSAQTKNVKSYDTSRFARDRAQAGRARRRKGRSTASDGEEEEVPAREAEVSMRGLQPVPAWQGEIQLRGLHPLPAWQGETVVRGLRRLFPRQNEIEMRAMQRAIDQPRTASAARKASGKTDARVVRRNRPYPSREDSSSRSFTRRGENVSFR